MSHAGIARNATAGRQAAAAEISRLLREAKVDAALRVKAFAALMLATAGGAGATGPLRGLAEINRQVGAPLEQAHLAPAVRRQLREALRLDAAHFGRMAPYLGRINAILAECGISLTRRMACDSLALFYEAFLRYGFDNNDIGIVFTPRHIAQFCVELVGISCRDRVIDLACGTGGFLIAARECALRQAGETRGTAWRRPHAAAGESAGPMLAGFETNQTVWALAVINTMLGGGADIRLGNCLATAQPPCRAAAVYARLSESAVFAGRGAGAGFH